MEKGEIPILSPYYLIKNKFSILLRQSLLVCLSGILVAVSFPPLGLWPCILVAWWPMFIAIKNATLRRSFYIGLLQGMVAYGITLHWFVRIFGFTAVALFVVISLFSALYCLTFNIIGREIKNSYLKALFATALWTSIEYFRCELFILRFAWITPGTALGPNWLLPFIGVYGVSCFVFSISSFLSDRKIRIAGVVIAICVFTVGIIRPYLIVPSKDNALRVAAVQSEECVLDTYLSFTKSIKDRHIQLIVWPEYSIPYDIRKKEEDFSIIPNLCEEIDTVVVFGTQTEIGSGVREWHNTALVVNSSGVAGEYYKARPVHFFNDGLPGKSFEPIETGIGAIGTPICFDCDYTEIIRRMTSNGAEFFAIPSFDSKSWSLTQHLQHSALFPLRAAENGRWIVLAASSGVSQIIDHHGNVRKSLGAMKEGVIVGEIERRTGMTFYTVLGWLFPWILMIASATSVCIVLYRRFHP